MDVRKWWKVCTNCIGCEQCQSVLGTGHLFNRFPSLVDDTALSLQLPASLYQYSPPTPAYVLQCATRTTHQHADADRLNVLTGW